MQKNPSKTKQLSELESLKKKTEEYLDGWKRAKADYANLQKRTAAQHDSLVRTATAELLKDLLPAMDNLKRAAQAKGSTEEIRTGVSMVAQQIDEIMAAQGLKSIESKDKPFDPALHEAIATVPGKKGICVEVHASGYKFHDKVLRPTQVSVGSGITK